MTVDDFGSQGSQPSHPDLLDWLAMEFCESGWNVKQLMKTLVMSATYRQSSVISPALSERDPQNRLLARGSRYRLQAEFIRDKRSPRLVFCRRLSVVLSQALSSTGALRTSG